MLSVEDWQARISSSVSVLRRFPAEWGVLFWYRSGKDGVFWAMGLVRWALRTFPGIQVVSVDEDQEWCTVQGRSVLHLPPDMRPQLVLPARQM